MITPVSINILTHFLTDFMLRLEGSPFHQLRKPGQVLQPPVQHVHGSLSSALRLLCILLCQKNPNTQLKVLQEDLLLLKCRIPWLKLNLLLSRVNKPNTLRCQEVCPLLLAREVIIPHLLKEHLPPLYTHSMEIRMKGKCYG